MTPYEQLARRLRWDDQHGVVHGPDGMCTYNMVGCYHVLSAEERLRLYLLPQPYQPVTCLWCVARSEPCR